jgi:hypothetical protein
VFLAYGALFGLWLFRRLHPKRPAVLPVVRVEPGDYVDFADVVEASLELAKRNGVIIAVEWRGVELRIRPTDSAASVLRDLSDARERMAFEDGKAEARAEAAAPIAGAPDASAAT